MSQLTSHVLDTAKGSPAQGIEVVLFRLVNNGQLELAKGITNADGRVSNLLPAETLLDPSTYKMVFATGKYFERQSLKAFYPVVEIVFSISDESHYHIPLLLSPYGYTTYRGS